MSAIEPQENRQTGILNTIERIGNAMPDITMLFIYALGVCWALSFALSFINFDYYHPLTGDQIKVTNMLAPVELVTFITTMVKNFINFPPLAITIVATLGIGVAEGSGFIQVMLKKMLNVTPQRILTPAVIFIGVVSHVASDSAYVILMPVSAMMFYASGRHPLAGIAAAFAGLAGGFSASYTPSIIDPIMQGFTQGAAHIIDPSYNVNVLCNYFLSFGSTFAVILMCWFITEKIVEPRLVKSMPLNDDLSVLHNSDELQKVTPQESKAFKKAGLTMLFMLIGLAAALYPENSLLRSPEGSLTRPDAPIMQAIVPLLFFMFAIPGLIYGFSAGTFKSTKDITSSMENITRSLVSFLVFSFFCAQFLYSFSHSNIGTLLAISGADFLRTLAMPAGFTILGVILLSCTLDIIITSASSKWSILAPVLVPMLMAVGISPELTQASFRVSSTVNISTPMFAFYPLIIMYCRQYCSKTGVGTLCAMMLPYTLGLTIVLTLMLYLFWGLGIPLGFQSGYTYPAGS